MSQEQLKAFIAKVKGDKSLQDKLSHGGFQRNEKYEMNIPAKLLTFIILSVCLGGCQYFMSPDKMAESIEADERCYEWKEETRREIERLGMEYTLFNRECKLNEAETMILGYQGEYETGDNKQDNAIRESWNVVKSFDLKK